MRALSIFEKYRRRTRQIRVAGSEASRTTPSYAVTIDAPNATGALSDDITGATLDVLDASLGTWYIVRPQATGLDDTHKLVTIAH